QTPIPERVLDLKAQRPRPAGLGVQDVLDDDPVRSPRRQLPVAPPNESVDRVVSLRLGQDQLVAGAGELEPSVAYPIGPRDQHLPAASAAHLVDRVAIQQRPVRGLVGSQSAPDLADDGALAVVAALVLLA